MLEIARAQRDVHHAERVLAECMVQEHKRVADLHRFKAQQKQESLDCKDLSIGWINALFGDYGRMRPIPTAKVRNYLPPTTNENGK